MRLEPRQQPPHCAHLTITRCHLSLMYCFFIQKKYNFIIYIYWKFCVVGFCHSFWLPSEISPPIPEACHLEDPPGLWVHQHQACVPKLATGEAGVRKRVTGEDSGKDIQQQQDRRLKPLSPAEPGVSSAPSPSKGTAPLRLADAWLCFAPSRVDSRFAFLEGPPAT